MKHLFMIAAVFIFMFVFADDVPPYVDPLYPTPDATGIPVDTDLTFHILDDADGVDIFSVNVLINGINYNYSSGYFYFSGEPEDYLITINPPNNFQFGQTVNVQIDGQDLANPPNVMDHYTYSFQCIDDLQPPYVGNLDPQINQLNVPVDTDVTFHIYDSGLGVNISSVVVNIQGVTYTHNDQNFTYSGIPHDYFITIDVPVNFGLGETVYVIIEAADINGLSMSPFEYSFKIIEDVEPPYTGEWLPQPGSGDVPIDTEISFNIYDNIEGVDISSINVLINSTLYTHLNSSFSYSAINNGYAIFIDPIADFGYGDSVTVNIDASDLAQPANQMDTFSYNFVIENDQQAPYLGNFSPAPDSVNVPINTDIAFTIFDDKSGVDINSLNVDVNGTIYTVNSGNLTYAGSLSQYYISIDPQGNFEYGEEVVVSVDVNDLASPANLLENFIYSFECYFDNDPPYLDALQPIPDAVNVELDSNISFNVIDIGFGVDINSLQVNVNDVTYSLALNNLYYTGGSDDYYIEINPEQYFAAGEIVEVQVDAADLASPPHQMATYAYSFQCVYSDFEPPFIWGEHPVDDAGSVPVNTDISLHINDEISGVDSASIVFKVEGQEIVDYQLIPEDLLTGSGYKLIYDPVSDFDYDQVVNISVAAADLAPIPNQMPLFEYSFQCISEIFVQTTEQKVIVEPHTVSWQNDKCEIKVFTNAEPENIQCKIFDRKGREIIELQNSNLGNPLIYEWYKKDKNGNYVSGGFYIYQVKVKSKVFQGSVIIAR